MNYYLSVMLLIWTSITLLIGRTSPTTVNSHTPSEMNEFLQKCVDFSFDLLPGYPVFNNISDQKVLNVAHGKFEAYIQFLQKRVMQWNDMYFSMKEFPAAYHLVFPPYFPIICYQVIMKSMNKEAHSSLRNVLPNIIKRQVWTSYEDTWYVQHYMRHRDQVYLAYNELANYLQDGSQRDTTALRAFCQEMSDVRHVAISERAKQFLDEDKEEEEMPEFNRLFLNNLAKLFIGDVVIQQIVVHGCMGLGYKPAFNQRQSWSRAMAELEWRESRIHREWPTSLEEEVHELPKSGRYENWNNWLAEIKQRLVNKYYWLFFRIHKYEENAKALCYNAPSMKCVKKDNIDIQIRWGQRGGQIEHDQPAQGATARPRPVIPSRLIQSHNYNPEFRPQPIPVTVDISSKMDALQADIDSSVTRIVDDMQNPQLQQFDNSQPLPVPEVFLAVRNAFKASVHVLDEVENRMYPLGQAACSYLPKANTERIFMFIKEKFSILHEKFEATSDKINSVLTYFDIKANFPNGHRPPRTQNWPGYLSYKVSSAARLSEFRNLMKAYGSRGNAPVHTTFVHDIKTLCLNGAERTTTPQNMIRTMYGQLIGEVSNPVRLGRTIISFYGVHYHRMHTLSAFLLNHLAEMLVFNTQCAFYRCSSGFDKFVKNVSDDAMEFAQEVRKEIFRIDNEYMYKWQNELRQVLNREGASDINDAAPLARRLEDLYPWNDFSVFVFKAYSASTRLPRIFNRGSWGPYYEETIFQFKWLANPDFSAVHRRAGAQNDNDTPDTYTIVNWGMRGQTPIFTRTLTTGLSSNCYTIYRFDSFLQRFFHKGISSRKSVFAMRTLRGAGCRPLNAELEDDEHAHTIEVDGHVRPHQETLRDSGHPTPCCGAVAGNMGIVFQEKHCYVYACGSNTCSTATDHRVHRHTTSAILAHVGTGY